MLLSGRLQMRIFSSELLRHRTHENSNRHKKPRMRKRMKINYQMSCTHNKSGLYLATDVMRLAKDIQICKQYFGMSSGQIRL